MLWVDFAGIVTEIEDRLTFGRSAELALDEDNRFMHRSTGEFRRVDSAWWLHNVGSSTRLLVFGDNGTRVELPPGTECALPLPAGSVSFVAGPTPYQLLYRSEPIDRPPDPLESTGEATVEYGSALTAREAVYLTTFALDRLRGTGSALLTYSDVATIWDVSEKTIDNTLQRVRSRLKAAGVRDTETLEGLVTHLLAHGRIGLGTLLDVENRHPGVLPD